MSNNPRPFPALKTIKGVRVVEFEILPRRALTTQGTGTAQGTRTAHGTDGARH